MAYSTINQLVISEALRRMQVTTQQTEDFEAGYWDHARVLGKDPLRKNREGYQLGWQSSKDDTKSFVLPRGRQTGQL